MGPLPGTRNMMGVVWCGDGKDWDTLSCDGNSNASFLIISIVRNCQQL